MSKETSHKITLLNYILACMIVLLHSCDIWKTIEFSGIASHGGSIVIQICTIIGRCAVPTYFAMSGYLFFRGCNPENIKGKLFRRLMTVLVPFIIWNLFFYFLYMVLARIPGIGSRINFEMPSFGFEEFVVNNTVNPPMWFLSRLLVLQFCSPIVLILFRKLRKYNLIWLFMLLFMDLIIGLGYKNPLHWAFTFYFSGYLAFFHANETENVRDKIDIPRWCNILLLSVALVLTVTDWIYWLVAPFLLFLLMSYIKDIRVYAFMKNGFFIICTHYFFVRVVRKVLTMLLGVSQSSMIINLLMTWIIVAIGLTIVAIIFKKLCPKTYAITCGAR